MNTKSRLRLLQQMVSCSFQEEDVVIRNGWTSEDEREEDTIELCM